MTGALVSANCSVALACVVSTPDPDYDEIGIAYLLTAAGKDLTVESIEAFARQRLANYKIPKLFLIRDTFPEVEVGKVDRIALSDDAHHIWKTRLDKA